MKHAMGTPDLKPVITKPTILVSEEVVSSTLSPQLRNSLNNYLTQKFMREEAVIN
jgi:hypothetical protein